MRIRAMSDTLYQIPVLIILLLASGLWVGCAPDLPEEEKVKLFYLGNDIGYGWGYWLMAENRDRTDIFWTRIHAVDEAQKFNPQVNIRDYYIPKGYWTIEDVANTHFPDGTPFNQKQKKQAMETYNWGFYTGFVQGCEDYMGGKSRPPLP